MGGLVASLIVTPGILGFGYISYVWRGYGLYTQLWAMVLLPPALAMGYRVLREGRGYFWATLLLAATLMSHVLYGYWPSLPLASSLSFNLYSSNCRGIQVMHQQHEHSGDVPGRIRGRLI